MPIRLVADVQPMVFDYLSPRDLSRLSQACMGLYTSVAAYLLFACSIRRRLSYWFTDVEAFRELQRCTGLLVSGSVALSLFERIRYRNTDIDLYVLSDQWKPVTSFMLRSGYQLVSTNSKLVVYTDPYDCVWGTVSDLYRDRRYEWESRHYLGYHLPGISAIVDFIDDAGRQAQVIFAVYSPLEVVLGFHSTVVMNVISHSSAICLYPYSTFVLRRSVVFGYTASEDKRVDITQKYGRRGWLFIPSPAGVLQHPEFALGCRRAGDVRCWTIPWDRSPYAVSDTTLGNSWRLEKRLREHISCRSYSPVRLDYTLFRTHFPGCPPSYLTVSCREAVALDLETDVKRDMIRNEWSYEQWLQCLAVLRNRKRRPRDLMVTLPT